MSQVSQQKVSANAGIISPVAAMRLDLERAANGCRVLKNFIPRPSGAFFKRPGTERLGQTRRGEEAVLKSFNYSANTRFQLELGDGYVRFWSNRQLVSLDMAGATVWKNTTAQYQVGEWTHRTGIIYSSKAVHTPEGSNQPPSSSWNTTNLREWAASTAYSLGEVVKISGVFYVCISAHTSGGSPNLSNFAVWGLGTAWAGATLYPVGSKTVRLVSGQMRAYRCKTGHTSAAGNAPGTGANWANFWDRVDQIQPHNSSSALYFLGDLVVSGGAVYVTWANHTSSSTNAPGGASPLWRQITGATPWVTASTSRAVGDCVVWGHGYFAAYTKATTGGGVPPPESVLSLRSPGGYVSGDRGLWTSTLEYKVGSVVAHTGGVFVCFRPHVSLSTNAPGTLEGNNYWQKVEGIPYWTPFTEYPDGSYVVGDAEGIFLFLVEAAYPPAGTIGAEIGSSRLTPIPWNSVDFMLPLELKTPYTSDQVQTLNPVGINDQIWMLHPDQETLLLERFGDKAWRIGPVEWDWPPMRDENINEGHTLAVSHTSGQGRTLTSNLKLFTPGMVGGYFAIGHRRDQSTVKLGFNASGTSGVLRFNGRLDIFLYGVDWKGDVHLEFSKDGATNWQTQRSWTQPVKNMRTISTFTTVEEETFARLRFVRDGGGVANDFGVIEAADSRIEGVVKITEVQSPTVAICDVVKDVWSTGTTTLWSEGAFSDHRGWPRAGTVHEQRLFLTGTKDESDKVWGSQIDGFFNFKPTNLADAAIYFVAASRESNALMWLESFGKALIMGSIAEEWSARNYDQTAISGENPPRVERETRVGSTDIPAALIGDALMFVSTDRTRVLEFSYSFADEKHIRQDMTQLSEHLFASGIRQVAVARNPDPVLYVLLGDGRFLTFTYDRNQNVAAWAEHEMLDAQVESVSIIYGGDSTDEVWFVVNRDGIRYVEAYHRGTATFRFNTDPELWSYLDSCIVQTLETPATVLPCPGFADGELLTVLGDGVPLGEFTVTGGEITLPGGHPPVEKFVAGYPFEAEFQGLWLDIPLQDGSAQDRKQRVAQVTVITHESNGMEYHPDPEDPTGKWYGTGLGDRTDVANRVTRPTRFKVTNPARHGYETNLTLRSKDPLPVNVLGLVYRNEYFG